MSGGISGVRVVECGGNGWCEFFALILQNEFIAATIFKGIAEAGAQASDWFEKFQPVVDAHGEKFIALAGVSFGIWKWWVFREAILHKRLEEYLRKVQPKLHLHITTLSTP